jgi:hypothetical protein
MTITNWNISREDHDLSVEVAKRALRELRAYPDDQRTLIMDLQACHANACPLDFKGLLEAPMQDFSHDVCGIRQYINRDTGQLDGFFTPRYALANRLPAGEWASIDGEEYTQAEADFLLSSGLIELCSHEECPHSYHAVDGIVDADLLVALERAGLGPRKA